MTPANSYGTGPATTSAAATPVAVTGGTAAYQAVLQDYLEAQNALLTGDGFSGLLDTEAPTVTLTDVPAMPGADGTVTLRAASTVAYTTTSGVATDTPDAHRQRGAVETVVSAGDEVSAPTPGSTATTPPSTPRTAPTSRPGHSTAVAEWP